MTRNNRHYTALVTGGGSGIGFATASALLAQGWYVLVVDRKIPSQFPVIGRSRTIQADVTETQAFSVVIDKLKDRLDALILCAAESPFAQEPEKIIQTNGCAVISNALACRSVLRRNASIILLGSTAAYRVSFTSAWQRLLTALLSEQKDIKLPADCSRLSGEEAYRHAKRIVIEATRPLARLMSNHCIRANCLVLGPTVTPMSRPVWHGEPARWKRLVKEAPFNHANSAMECANVIAFLSGPSTRNLTGCCLYLDGGWFITHEY